MSSEDLMRDSDALMVEMHAANVKQVYDTTPLRNEIEQTKLLAAVGLTACRMHATLAMTSPNRWRLDRQVSLGLLVAVALQAAAALMWAGRASARIDDLRQRLDAQAPVAERLARLETQAEATRAALARIESKLDQQ